MTLPVCETLQLEQRDHALFVTFNRPEVRNALSLAMVQELMSVLEAASTDNSLRAIVLRGSGGHFCAGGDIRDMANARARLGKDDNDPFYALNRCFGQLLEMAEQAPQVIVCVLEGTVMGGGFGLACISDVALAHSEARFALPETSLGIPPAQIAPFVVKRIGLTQARRLALLGESLSGDEATILGIAHSVYRSTEALEEALAKTLSRIKRCAPGANAVTKRLMLAVGKTDLGLLLDDAASAFSDAIQGEEGVEGTTAFMQKRKPAWAAEQESEA
ncbi:enoyl-CoA hydratase/isomerase family protein [Kistimonas asteriae]|uniref:enoyl-CoA hydratase/isomerase family protein n=1 Tax=Kistimonas asteriae TaxID=517724 RepID=UPI001BA81414|nr:enoyl-CoA hydratase-related protein [Kistimonas asteriae]